eukprot:10278446-Ditylum_brightwellii.AAC.1
MGKYDKPSKLINQIKIIENQFSGLNKKMDKKDKIALVLEKAPKGYVGILAITEQEKGSSLTMKNLENAMKTQFCIWYGDSNVQGDGDELALSEFDGKCYKCGLLGLKANKCPKRKHGNFNGNFNGKCNRCGRIGHKLDKCWENENNANKRPNWLKSNKEKGLVAKDDKNGQYEDTKFLLMGM